MADLIITQANRFAKTSFEYKENLRNILLKHHGSNDPIKAHELKSLFNQKDDRRIRQAIRELRHEGLPVLSNGDGYFLPNSWNEVNECLTSLRSRLIEDAKTRRDIKVSSSFYLTKDTQPRLI